MEKRFKKMRVWLWEFAKWFNRRLIWFSNRKIITKLLSGFILVTIISSIAGYIGISNIKLILKKDEEMFNKLNAPMVYITYLNESYFKLRYHLVKSVDLAGNTYLSLIDINKARTEIEIVNEGLEETWLENEKETVDTYKKSLKNLYPMLDKFNSFLQSGDKSSASAFLNSNREFNNALDEVEENIRRLTNSKIENGNNQLRLNKDIGNKALFLMLLIIFISVLISAAIGIYISFLISVPIKNLTKIASKIAEGDTTTEPEVLSKDEVGMLSKAFINMIENIREQALTVEKVGSGESDIYIKPKSENDVLSKGIEKVVTTFEDLQSEINYLIKESEKENFNAIGDLSKFSGRNRDIIAGINKTLEVVREKIFWYECILDSIPLPVCVTDLYNSVTFINKPVEKMLNLSRSDILGIKCNESETILNRTEFLIEKLHDGESQIDFEHESMHYQADTSYLYDTKKNITGYVEVLQNITARIKAHNYQVEEVEKLSNNLRLFAEGNLKLNFEVGEGDEYTIEEKKIFTEINRNLEKAIESISIYIGEVKNVLSELSDGNLKLSIDSEYKGDFVEIKKSLNSIIESLNIVIGDVNTTAIQVAAGAKMVSEGSSDLSQGASEQASSVEELTATIAEVASQTKSNAISASETNELAISVRNKAVQGNKYMEEMLEAMKEIDESCNNISKIIKVIDEIAFQTNILALNASVEAARAGQQGRGFTVVAEEVRNLASRSAQAAKETSALIENSLNIVNKGAKKAQQTYDELNIIVNGIEKASELISGIAKSTEEQANSISQINQGIEQVSRVVQANSATAEEGSAASEELASHAERLRRMVGRFVLKNESKSDTDFVWDKDVDSSYDEEIDFNIKRDIDDKDFGKY